MVFKSFSFCLVVLLIATAATPSEGKKSGGTWFFPGGGHHNNNAASLREQLTQIELNNNANLLVKLSDKNLPVAKTTLIANNWKNLLHSVGVQIEPTVISEDTIIVKVVDGKMYNDVKIYLNDELSVNAVLPINELMNSIENGEIELPGMGENENEQENENNEQEMEQEQEQEYRNEKKSSKKGKKSKSEKSKKSKKGKKK